jgi:hypothetical protein
MVRVRELVSAASFLFVTVAGAGCTGKDPYAPGTALGTFRVDAALTSSTCGDAPNPWSFDVRLAHDGATVFWIQGGAPIEGKLDATTKSVKLSSRSEETVRPADAKAKLGACVLAREDALEVQLADATGAPLADASAATAFKGTLIYRFAPLQGADCSDQVAEGRGGYAALPCAVTYAVTAVRTKAPPSTASTVSAATLVP